MKKPWLIISLLLLFLPIIKIFGQEESKKSRWLYLETGVDFMQCSAPDHKTYIRADNTPNPYYYQTSYVMALLYSYHASARLEFRAWHEKLGLISGIRYSRIESSIGKEEYWNTGTDYFFVMINSAGTNTEYLKVKDITEKASYFGVPVELRFYPYENRKVQIYYKIGFDINFRTGSKTNVSFSNSQMNQYKNEVISIVEEPWAVYSSMHLGVGVKIGSYDKPGLNLEARVPSVIFYKKSNSFVDPNVGGGLAVSVRIPF